MYTWEVGALNLKLAESWDCCECIIYVKYVKYGIICWYYTDTRKNNNH